MSTPFTIGVRLSGSSNEDYNFATHATFIAASGMFEFVDVVGGVANLAIAGGSSTIAEFGFAASNSADDMAAGDCIAVAVAKESPGVGTVSLGSGGSIKGATGIGNPCPHLIIKPNGCSFVLYAKIHLVGRGRAPQGKSGA